jgi:endo-1,4-beta-xylanase
MYKLVKDLRDKGVPIHGLGLQGHWSVYEPTEETLTATFEKLKGLGVQLQITELDLSVYPKEHSRRERKPEDADAAYTTERENLQIEM